MDEACKQDIRQFHEQPEIFDFEDSRPENLRIARVELALEKLQLLHFHAVHFRFGGHAFGFGNVFRDGCDRHDLVGTLRCGVRSAQRADPTRLGFDRCETAMDNEIGVTADGAGEMRVVIFRQTVMAERLRRITGPLQTFQEADLQRLLLRFASERGQQALQFRSLGQIADLVAVAEDQLPIFRQLLRIGIFVDAINGWNEPVLQLARDGFIRREHELLDQLMGLVVLDPLELDRLALRVEPHFHFRKIEIERALLETVLAQERRHFPGDVETFG